MNIPELKKALWEKNIKQIKIATILREKYGFNIDSSRLSKMLKGYEPMKYEIKEAIKEIIENYK